MRIKTILLTGLGFFFLGMGAVGLILPVWPTTPFVLVSAACFSATPRLKARIMQISFFREYIVNYEKGTGLSRKTVLTSLLYLWGMLLLSMVIMKRLWLTCLLAAVGIAVTGHILWISGAKGEKRKMGIKPKRVFGIFEAVFDVFYLVAASFLGFLLLAARTDSAARMLAGVTALILVIGDSFHLFPRIKVILTGQEEEMRRALGRGKQITSITMTVFYLLLWQIGNMIFSQGNNNFYSYIVYILAAVRILLCLLPQNKWQDRYPPVNWGILRNIPFFLSGVMTAGLYFFQRNSVAGFGWMWLAITLSFVFYLPVVFWSNRNPKIGMMMLPKTCAYLWMLFMCLSL